MNDLVIQARKDYSRFSMALFAIAAIAAALQTVLALLFGWILNDSALGQMQIVRWLLSFGPLYLAAVPVGLRLMQKIPGETVPAQKLGFKRFLALMFICMPIMYGGNYIGTMLSALLSGGTAENAVMDFVVSSPLYSFVFAVLLAPFLEEYIFRKQIIDRLGKYGEKTAVIFSALTFGLFHMNLFQFFYAFGLGLIFAYVYTRTRMLRYSVIMHMIINLMGSVIAPMLLSGLNSDDLAAVEAGTATTEQLMRTSLATLALTGYSLAIIGAVIAGLVLLIIRWRKRQFLPASQELPPYAAGSGIYKNAGMYFFCGFCLIMMVLALL